jgi:hypothetical protein
MYPTKVKEFIPVYDPERVDKTLVEALYDVLRLLKSELESDIIEMLSRRKIPCATQGSARSRSLDSADLDADEFPCLKR